MKAIAINDVKPPAVRPGGGKRSLLVWTGLAAVSSHEYALCQTAASGGGMVVE
ncbi:MAG: hypothetical protein PHE96_11280 [Methylococcales bacterium]|nr:hypothetical protein [Methylococcales bacterium]